MIRCLIVFVITTMVCSGSYARLKERPSESCRDLDMSNADAVVQCLKDDHTYQHKLRHRFDTRVSCPRMQDLVLKRYIVSTNPELVEKMDFRKRRRGDSLPRPTCEVIAEVTQIIANTTPMWHACLGYEQASDKFEHFKQCVIGYTQGYYRYPNREAAIATVSGYDCQRLVRSYESAFKYIYRVYFPENQPGTYTPDGYSKPTCTQIDPWLASLKQEKLNRDRAIASRQREQYRAERTHKQQQKAEALQKARARAENQRRVEAALDKSYDFSEQFERQLAAVNAMEHPRDRIENKHIRRAIIQAIQKLVPEQVNTFAGLKGVVKHTTGGFRSYVENQPNSPKVFYGVDNAKIQTCQVKNGKARCKYTATFFTNVDNSALARSAKDRAALDWLYKTLAGPRTVTFENAFNHNGKQWKAVLSAEQRKAILPPPPPKSNANERDKVHCDVMTAMGIPMLC